MSSSPFNLAYASKSQAIRHAKQLGYKLTQVKISKEDGYTFMELVK